MLRSRITAGELAPGDRLPSERELAAEHDAARNTARQAIAILQAEGLVRAEQGRGVFVRRRPPLLRLGSDRYDRRHREGGKSPFATEMERQGRAPRVEVPHVGPIPAPAEVATRLGLDPGDQVLRRENHYFADDEPLQIGRTYFPWDLVKDSALTQTAPGPGGIYARLEDLGHQLTRMREDVTSRMPTPEEVEDLAIGAGVPVVDVWHTTFDQDAVAIETTHFVLPADRHQLSYEMPIN